MTVYLVLKTEPCHCDVMCCNGDVPEILGLFADEEKADDLAAQYHHAWVEAKEVT